ncbi:hypothetical protein C8250_021775 [Streptomyces sp. So13.3]|uniref:hypothetical protein n=1 Tax=Streptomyces sp. So13.3 TaxID=2136173 RepID=UPI0011066964|nr:hypothetical protein [Streptomyces sp. So13.3]QNA74188.1 hypothetical protein C8250_021775 [Streptomyces sp. So13.3]
MRTFVAGQEALSASEFTELALGIEIELFTGVPGESPEERRPRLAVALEVIKDLSEHAPEDAAFAKALMRRRTVQWRAA